MPESKTQNTDSDNPECSSEDNSENKAIDYSNPDRSQLHRLELLVLESLEALPCKGIVKVALSGGLDSKSLLASACELRDKGHIQTLEALHVDHGIQEESKQWLQSCQKDCDALGIKLVTTQLAIQEKALPSNEAFAREKRYQFFTENLAEGECLLFAHHQDDQAETLMLRLLRGCGVKGAAAMPESRRLGSGILLRPWLNVSRGEIKRYAEEKGICWVEDPSNAENQYDRNFLRNLVLPKLMERWPAYAKTFARFSAHAKEQTELLAEFSQIDLENCQSSYSSLSLEKLNKLSPRRQKNLLYHWGVALTKFAPSQTELDEALKQAFSGSEKSICVDFAGRHLRSFSGSIYLIDKKQPDAEFSACEWQNLDKDLVLSNQVVLSSKVVSDNSTFAVRLPKTGESIWVKMRKGGELVLPHYREKSNRLKIIYQECKVPVWRRDWLPLVYYGQELVTVPGVFVNKNFQAQAGESAIEFEVVD